MTYYIADPRIQLFDSTGRFLRGGKLYVYATGTTTKIAVYSNPADAEAGRNNLTNPVILDQTGSTSLAFLQTATFTLKDRNDITVWTLNDISPFSSITSAGIFDANGNELVKFTKVNGALNEVTITNAATGNAPSIKATGDNDNINLLLQGKGTTGRVIIPKLSVTTSLSRIGRIDAFTGSTGYIGELLETTVATGNITYVAMAGSVDTLHSLSLTAGSWLLSGGVGAINASGFALKGLLFYLENNANPGTPITLKNGQNFLVIGSPPYSTEYVCPVPNILYATSSAKTINIRMDSSQCSGGLSVDYRAWIKARRIA